MSVTLDPDNPKDLRAALYLIADHVDDVWGHLTIDEHKALSWMSVYDDVFSRVHFLEREAAEQAQEAKEAAKLAEVLADFAVADEHTGQRDDLVLAQHLVRRGVRVVEVVKK